MLYLYRYIEESIYDLAVFFKVILYLSKLIQLWAIKFVLLHRIYKFSWMKKDQNISKQFLSSMWDLSIHIFMFFIAFYSFLFMNFFPSDEGSWVKRR